MCRFELLVGPYYWLLGHVAVLLFVHLICLFVVQLFSGWLSTDVRAIASREQSREKRPSKSKVGIPTSNQPAKDQSQRQIATRREKSN